MKKQTKITELKQDELKRQRPLNAEIAQRILKEEGLTVTLEEAGKILEFMRQLAGITVQHHILKNKK